MKIYRLALCALLLGGCVTVNNPTVNATANTAIDATANTQAQIVAGPAPVEVQQPPAPQAPQFKTYQDYTFEFQYPGHWQAKDISIQEFASVAGVEVAEGATGKVAMLGADGSDAVLLVLMAEAGSLQGGAESTVPPGRKTEIAWGDSVAPKFESQSFRDGASRYLFGYALDRGGYRYAAVLVSGADVSLDTMDQLEQLVIGTWKWKGEPGPVPSVKPSTPTASAKPIVAPTQTPDPCPALQQKLNADINAVTIKYNKLIAELNGSLEPISSGLREARLKSLQDARAKELDQLKAAYTEKCPG